MTLAPAVSARQDNRTWQRAYEDGTRQLAAGQFADAELSFRRSLEHPTSPTARSASVVFSGTDRKPYYPEYFLALTLLRQGKDREALTWFERVRRERLVAGGSDEARALGGHIDAARKAIASPPPPPPPPPKPPTETPFDRQLKEAESAAGQGRLQEALSKFDALLALDAPEYGRRNLAARRAQIAQQRAAQLVAEGDRLRAAGQLSQALEQYRAADGVVAGAGQPGIREVDRLNTERDRLGREEQARSLVQQGDSFVRAGNYPAAIKSYRQALQLDPQNQVARARVAAADRFDGSRERALRFRRQKRLADARRAFEDARAADEGRFRAEGLADMLAALEKAPEGKPPEPPGTSTPPDAALSPDQVPPLRDAVVAYLRGDARRAVGLLEGMGPGAPGFDTRVQAHVSAWLAVSYAELSLAATEEAAREDLRRKAVDHFKQLVAVEPNYSLNEHVVSPRVRQLLTAAGGPGK